MPHIQSVNQNVISRYASAVATDISQSHRSAAAAKGADRLIPSNA